MELEAIVKHSIKNGPPDWVAECPILDIITQGHSREDSLDMLRSAIEELMQWYFPDTQPQLLKVRFRDRGKSSLGVLCSDVTILMSFVLIRQRELSGLNIREVSKRLGSRSPTAYARYESGETNMSVKKFDQLMQAVSPKSQLQIRVVYG